MKKLFLLLIVTVCGLQSGVAMKLRNSYLTAENGLKHLYVRALLQDKYGYVWMGATDGLCRYDGYSMVELTPEEAGDCQLLLDTRILSLSSWTDRFVLVRQRGRLYSCFDVEEEEFVDFTGDGSYKDNYQFPKVMSDKTLWFYDLQKGCKIIRFSDGKFSNQRLIREHGDLPDNGVTFVDEGTGGRYWIGTQHGAAFYQNGKTTIVDRKENFAAMVMLGGREYLLTRDGKVFTANSRGQLSLQSAPPATSAARPAVRSVIALQRSILLTTDGDTYEYIPRERRMELSQVAMTKADIVEDNRGNHIIYTQTGQLWYVDKEKRTPMHLHDVYSEVLLKLNSENKFCFVTDRYGTFWVSTYGNGLFAYDTKTGEQTHYMQEDNSRSLLRSNYLLTLMEDREGNIWTMMENLGLVCITRDNDNSHYTYFTTEERNDHTNNIRMVKRMPNGIYIANKQNGVRIAEGNLMNQRDLNYYDDDLVALCADHDGTVWAGTRRRGIFVGDRNYQHASNDPKSISGGKVSEILCDHKGRMWVAIFDNGLNLAEKQPDGSYAFRHFFVGKHTVRQPRLLLEDHAGMMWLCTSEGAYIFNPDKLMKDPGAYEHFNVNGKDYRTDELRYIYEDSHHHVWIGTMGYGVAMFDNSTPGKPKKVQMFSMGEGMPDNNVQSIIEDQQGNIWFGTDHGLAMYDYHAQAIRSFFPANNHLGNMFEEKSVCRLDNGDLAFGTKHGILTISPLHLNMPQPAFQLMVTNVEINGADFKSMIGEDVVEIEKGEVRSVRVAHDQNSLTFYFSDFEYRNGRNTKYTYRLEGYEDDWSPLSTLNFAQYKNLPPGSYTLHVKAQSSNGVWNPQEVVVRICVRPPWYNTWWAYLLYVALLSLIAWLIYHRYKREQELRNKIKVEEQLTHYKIRFFTNVSHEFRTPLTIINGAMEHLLSTKSIPGDMKQPLSSMKKSTDRLQRMVNQLMEFSKVHAGKQTLQLQEGDLVGFVRDIFYTFRELAENKHIDYNFSTQKKTQKLFFDRNHIDKIVYNLISNAFKYTPSGGEINVRMELEDGWAVLCVTDTGIGIPKEKQADLFTRFNQSAFSRRSIGIGLHLTHELVQVHHGQISYEENSPQGSIFTLKLPVDRSCYTEADFMAPASHLLEEEPHTAKESFAAYKGMAPDPINDKLVMIVDDDGDVLEFVKNELQPYFEIVTASDGKEALELLNKEGARLPDLLITDAAMPVMDGYELTRKIRSNELTADLPVIMLTALTADEKKMKGLSAGADVYIEKPFSVKILVTQCSQILMQRSRLKQQYASEKVEKAALPEIITDDRDARFRNLLDTWLEAHLTDPQLNVVSFAESMGYGRTTFFKKVKQVTGKTPNDYIRTLRLERAAELLRDDHLTIAQVAYQVGIDDPYYFSKTFKAHFGITPSKYRGG